MLPRLQAGRSWGSRRWAGGCGVAGCASSEQGVQDGVHGCAGSWRQTEGCQGFRHAQPWWQLACCQLEAASSESPPSLPHLWLAQQVWRQLLGVGGIERPASAAGALQGQARPPAAPQAGQCQQAVVSTPCSTGWSTPRGCSSHARSGCGGARHARAAAPPGMTRLTACASAAPGA